MFWGVFTIVEAAVTLLLLGAAVVSAAVVSVLSFDWFDPHEVRTKIKDA
jgi:hypothetical protein